VSTVAQLQSAVNGASAGTTIVVQDGVYNLDGVYLRIAAPNITLRSASGNPQSVVLDGNYVTTEIVQVVASNVTVAELTLREAYYHPIHVSSTANSHTLNTKIYRVRVIDGAEQQIKINPGGAGFYADNGTVACSHIELTDAGRPHVRNNCYTGGVDAHQARGWTIRDNWIGGFWCSDGLSEHGIHFWTGSRDTTIERNTLVNNARGIGCGLLESGSGRTYGDNPCPTASGYVDHYGAMVRNNFVFVNSAALFASQFGFDCGICIWQTCGAQVLHNTVYSTQAPFSSIEWRFGNTVVDVRNNLVSHNLRDRGGTDTQAGNLQSAPAAMFRNVASGDLRLKHGATAAIDQGAPVSGGLANDDIDGDTRPIGAARDIGADEFIGASIPKNVTTPTVVAGAASDERGDVAHSGDDDQGLDVDVPVSAQADTDTDPSRGTGAESSPGDEAPPPAAVDSADPSEPEVPSGVPAAAATATVTIIVAAPVTEAASVVDRSPATGVTASETEPRAKEPRPPAGLPDDRLPGGDHDWPTLVIAAVAGVVAGGIVWKRHRRGN
jgi:hypothetical protein